MHDQIEAINRQFDRLPPYSLDAEQCVLASMMLDADIARKVRRIVTAESFFSVDNQIIFAELCEMADAGKPPDPTLLRESLTRKQRLDEVGGVQYLVDVLNTVPSAAHGEHYAGIVREKAKLRGLIRICNDGLRSAYAPLMEDGHANSILQEMADKLWKIRSEGENRRCVTLDDAVSDFLKAKNESPTGATILTGIPQMDIDFPGLLCRQGYTIVAGRPSMGKSTLVRHMLDLLTRPEQGRRCGLIAIEESIPKIAGNYLSAHSGIENRQVAAGTWGEHEWNEIEKAQTRLAGRPLFIIDDAFDVKSVLDAFEYLASEKKCDVIAVDHVHLLGFEGGQKTENRNQELSKISRQMKQMIRRYNVSGMICAQLSRPPKGEGVPAQPQLQDLRDSGSLEQDADAVLMIHREDYYRRGTPGFFPTHVCELLIRKLRNGAIGMVELKEEMQYQRFADAMPKRQEDENDPF